MGTENTILLLHGALGSEAQMEPLGKALQDDYTVHRMTFPGHGGRAHKGPYSIDLFAESVLAYLDKMGMARANIFGFSMGGYVAVRAACMKPDRVGRIMTLGTKWVWDPESARHEIRMLDPSKILEKVPRFARVLEKRHHPLDWQGVLQESAAMMIRMGDGEAMDLQSVDISNEILISVGEFDNMVSVEESRMFSRSLPQGQFHLFPGFKHPIEQVDLAELSRRILSFFDRA